MKHTVVEICVGVPLSSQDLLDPVVAPSRPVVGGKHDFCLLTKEVQSLPDLLRPQQGVPNQGSPQRVDVVDRGGDILRRPEGLEIGEVGVHLGWGFGTGCAVKDHADTIDDVFFDVVGYDESRSDETHRPGGHVLADCLVDMTVWVSGSKDSVLKERTAVHRVAGIDILSNCMLHEAIGDDDGDPPRTHVGLVYHASHATEVVGMGVGMNNRGDGSLPQLGVDEHQGSAGGLDSSGCVENDPTGLAPNECHVGEVESPHLPDPGHHLIEAVIHIEDRLTLQRGVNAVEVLAVHQEVVPPHVPGDVAGIRHDLGVIRLGYESSVLFLEVPFVIKGQSFALSGLEGFGE